MSLYQVLMTHMIARKENKPPFFFSRFNFDRMKKCGNTHFCFYCLSSIGFKPDNVGNPTNHIEDGGYNGMNQHDVESHANGVIGDADKYDSVWEWLENSITKDFPFIVTVPSA